MFRTGNTEIEKEASETYTQMAKQLSITFSEYISRVDQTTRMVDNTADIPRYLRNKFTDFETSPAENSRLEQSAMSALELVARTNSDIYSLIITSLDGSSISYVDGKFDRPLLSIDEDYYAPLRTSTGNTVLLPARTSQYEFSADARVFSIACKHLDVSFDNDVSTNFYTGYVISECPVSKLSEVCDNSNFGKGALLYIVDNTDTVVYTTFPDRTVSEKMVSLFKAGQMKQKTAVDGKSYFLVSSEVPETGWSVLAALPYDFITANSQRLIQRFTLLCLICAAIITVITAIVSFYFTKPIKELQYAMKKVGNGDLSTRITENRGDEFGNLYSGFNKLVEEINKLICAVSESEERETMAKYQMLQSQINPHFLYNSLDTIRMMAVLDDKNDIAEALLNLSSLFRYNIRNSDKLVTVKEELLQIKNYLSLQKLRLQEKLEIIYDTDDSALSCYMPKIILQPILENCFSHGFKDITRNCVITIKIKKCEKLIEFTISDNGVGMDKKSLDELNGRLLSSISPSEHGIGLYNVSERLRLYFGEQFRLRVESRENDGTDICFSIPSISSTASIYGSGKPQ